MQDSEAASGIPSIHFASTRFVIVNLDSKSQKMRQVYQIEESPPQSAWKRWKAKLVSPLKVSRQEKLRQAASSEPPLIDTPPEEPLDGDYLQRPDFAWQKSQFFVRDHMQLAAPISQQQSILFRLPIEVREVVYKHVFGPSLIHLEAISRRFAHITCGDWQPGDGWDGHVHLGATARGLEARRHFYLETSPNDQLLAICLTCKIMWVIFPGLYQPKGYFGGFELDAD